MKYKSQRGITFIETIISTVIVLIGTVIMISTIDRVDRSLVGSDRGKSVLHYHTHMISNLKKAILSTENEKKEKVEGVCRALDLPQNVQIGVTEVNLDLSKIDEILDDKERWSKFFDQENWKKGELSGGSVGNLGTCKNEGRSICYQIKKSSSLKGEFSEEEIKNLYFSGEIVLKKIDVNTGKMELFSPVKKSDKKLNAKNVVFELVSNIIYLDKADSGKSFSRMHKSATWSGESSGCDYTIIETGGKRKKATVHFIATGLGSPGSFDNIYNTTVFSKIKRKPISSPETSRTKIQKGRRTNRGMMLADSDKNISLACEEIQHRCPKSKSNREFKNDIYMKGLFNYSPSNSAAGKIPKTTAKLNPKFNISIDGSKILNSKDVEYQFYWGADDIKNYRLKKSTNETLLVNPKNGSFAKGKDEKQLIVKPGDNRYAVKVSNTNLSCKKICNARLENKKIKGAFSIELLNYMGKGKNYSETLEVKDDFGCTACYMKSCQRYGIETFGTIEEQPPEPLDSLMPECASKGKVKTNNYSSYLGKFRLEGSGQCLYFDGSDPTNLTNKIKRGSCSESKSVACYNFGKFLLARNFDRKGYFKDVYKAPLSLVSGNKAQMRCQDTSLETSEKSLLENIFDQYDKNPDGIKDLPGAGGQYTIYNNAKKGLFQAPVVEDQIDSLKEFMGKYNGRVRSTWIGMKATSKNGILYGSIPFMDESSSLNRKYALYFDLGGRINLDHYPKSPESYFGRGDGMILSHNVKYKGVREASGYEAYPFLCRNKQSGKLFKTQRRSKNHWKGSEYCKNEGGKFLPPVMPMEWVKAFELVQASHRKYPFPNPKSAILPAWIGLKKGAGSDGVELAQTEKNIITNYFIKNLNRIFRTVGDKEDSTTHSLCLNKERFEVSIKTVCDIRTERKLTESSIIGDHMLQFNLLINDEYIRIVQKHNQMFRPVRDDNGQLDEGRDDNGQLDEGRDDNGQLDEGRDDRQSDR